MRILLVEPDRATAQSIELMLKTESMNVYTTDRGDEAIDLGKLYDYDIILLALNLDDMSGYEVLRTLRQSKVKTPIMILSGLSGIEDKVRGLGFGADDYLTKPFHKDELVARIHSIIRRSKGHAESVVTIGNLSVSFDRKQADIEGRHIHLTGKEFTMLELLALRKGTTVTKEMFLNHLYGGLDEPEIKIIDVFLCKLRKKLRAANRNPQDAKYEGQSFIETVWGRGYILKEDAHQPTSVARRSFNGAANMTKRQVEEEMRLMRTQMDEMRRELGLSDTATMDETMQALRDYRKRAEDMLEDAPGHGTGNGTDHHYVGNGVGQYDTGANGASPNAGGFQILTPAQSGGPSGYEGGIRTPIGSVFTLGSYIVVDTNEGVLANPLTGDEAKIPPVVGTILEVMGHYQGRELNKDKLIAYIFEKPQDPRNDARLGMYMSQAQAGLTQVIGRAMASLIVQVLSGGSYGMPQMNNILTAQTPAGGAMLQLPHANSAKPS